MSMTAYATATEIDLPPPPPLDVAHSAVFCDLDGTLAPIEITPPAVTADAGRRRLLQALGTALSGRLAIVSGRAIEDLDRILEGQVTPLAAVHGLVRRDARGVVHAAPAGGGVAEAAAAFQSLAAADRRLLVENKGAAVALHYRRAPSAAEACRELALRLADRLGLTPQEGDMVIELKSPGGDKGAAVRAFMAEAPFAGARPIFLGDDFTDESGFVAAQVLGGAGIVVGARRPTAARWALAGVAETLAWLAAASGASL